MRGTYIMQKKNKTFKICLTGMMSALVLIGTSVKIFIPIGSYSTMIHFGNAFCLLSALLLGPINGGLASGIGSLLFDLLNPMYITSAPFTFIFKFIMGFVCALIAKRNPHNTLRIILASTIASLIYIILYISKNFIKNALLLNIEIHTSLIIMIKSLCAVLINAFFAVIIAATLFKIIQHTISNIKH